MGNRLSFYFSQGTKNVRKSFLIIIGLSLALSMVSGISLYIDSYQKNLVNESFYQILDYDVKYGYEVFSNNISESLRAYDSSVTSVMLDAEKLEIISNFQYYTIDSWDLTFYKNYTKDTGEEFHGYELVEGNDVRIGLFDENFYLSKRFDKYFSILNGTFPKSEEEIMIPIDLAYKMNITLDQTTNLYIKPEEQQNTINSTLSLSDVKVVGIYAGKLRAYAFSEIYCNHGYEYHLENNTVSSFEDIGQHSREMVFCNYNFSEPKQTHPVQILITNYNSLSQTNTSDYYLHYSSLSKYMGEGFCMDRKKIDFGSINSYARKLSQEVQIVERQIGTYTIHLEDYISWHLSNLYLMSSMFRIILQILNIPILIFAIFIGSFAIKTNTKSRLDEFLLLRSKGSPNSLLRNQFIIAAIFNGIAASTVALIAGFGTFFGFRQVQ